MPLSAPEDACTPPLAPTTAPAELARHRRRAHRRHQLGRPAPPTGGRLRPRELQDAHAAQQPERGRLGVPGSEQLQALVGSSFMPIKAAALPPSAKINVFTVSRRRARPPFSLIRFSRSTVRKCSRTRYTRAAPSLDRTDDCAAGEKSFSPSVDTADTLCPDIRKKINEHHVINAALTDEINGHGSWASCVCAELCSISVGDLDPLPKCGGGSFPPSAFPTCKA